MLLAFVDNGGSRLVDGSFNGLDAFVVKGGVDDSLFLFFLGLLAALVDSDDLLS